MLRAFWLGLAFTLGSCLAALVGCGGEGSTATSEPAAVVDSRPPGERLAGQWVGALVVDEEGVKGLAPEQIAAAQQARLGIAFGADGTMVEWDAASAQSPEVPGSWQLVSHEGDNITIKSTSAGGKQKDIVIMFESPDSFLMPLKTEVANLGAMRFERMR